LTTTKHSGSARGSGEIPAKTKGRTDVQRSADKASFDFAADEDDWRLFMKPTALEDVAPFSSTSPQVMPVWVSIPWQNASFTTVTATIR
jgi:hypothetical protein